MNAVSCYQTMVLPTVPALTGASHINDGIGHALNHALNHRTICAGPLFLAALPPRAA